jgi:hypothetical protein
MDNDAEWVRSYKAKFAQSAKVAAETAVETVQNPGNQGQNLQKTTPDDIKMSQNT